MSLELRIALAIFASYRLAELLTLDDGPFEIFLRFRKYCGQKASSSKFMREIALLLQCPFCTGVWTSILVTVILWIDSPVVDWIMLILAIAGVQTFLEAKSGNR